MMILVFRDIAWHFKVLIRIDWISVTGYDTCDINVPFCCILWHTLHSLHSLSFCYIQYHLTTVLVQQKDLREFLPDPSVSWLYHNCMMLLDPSVCRLYHGCMVNSVDQPMCAWVTWVGDFKCAVLGRVITGYHINNTWQLVAKGNPQWPQVGAVFTNCFLRLLVCFVIIVHCLPCVYIVCFIHTV